MVGLILQNAQRFPTFVSFPAHPTRSTKLNIHSAGRHLGLDFSHERCERAARKPI